MGDDFDLKKFLETRANEKWETDKQPYYLANVSPELKKKGLNYFDYTDGMKLKEFVGERASDIVKLLQHPSERAKVGIIPVGQQFSFEDSNVPKPRSRPAIAHRASRYPVDNESILLAFIKLVSELPDEMAKEINVPISVLGHMLKRR